MKNKEFVKKNCPVCNEAFKKAQSVFFRYPDHVCAKCSTKTTDKNGRALRFYNPYPLGHGCAAKYSDNDEVYDSEYLF